MIESSVVDVKCGMGAGKSRLNIREPSGGVMKKKQLYLHITIAPWYIFRTLSLMCDFYTKLYQS